MKTKHQYLFIALALSASLHQAGAQGTEFTYQGRLNSGTNPANGTYDMEFRLFDSLAFGNPVGTTNRHYGTAVSNGLFTVVLGFGPNVFTGDPRWLSISVRTNDGGAFTPLTPLQPLTPTPYALFATTVAGAGIQDATVTGAKLAVPLTLSGSTASGTVILSGINDAGNGLAGTSTSGRGVYGKTAAGGLTNAGVYGENSAADGTAILGTALNVDSIGVTGFADWSGGIGVYGRGVDRGVLGATTGGTGVTGTSTTGPGVFGSSTSFRGVYGVADGAGGTGVYGRGANNGVVGTTTDGTGVSGTSSSGPGVYGVSQSFRGVHGVSAAAGPGVAGVYGENFAFSGTGIIGVGRAVASAGVAGVGDAAGSTGVYGRGTLWGGYFEGNLGVSGAESFGSTTRQMLNLWSTSYGIGVQNSALYQRTASEFFWYRGGTHSDTFGDAGGGTQLMRLGNTGDLIVTRNASVCSLTIRGGCDLAEPFQMSTKEIPEGAVVVIDDENAGQLKLSDRAYDSRVAGILSGANGINSGISLHQEGVLEGGQNVALSGRVYVLADAASNPIKPGDLLTTSSIPGHAMKATDHARASGAILGKAMSCLNQGRGMVLVLVSLQ